MSGKIDSKQILDPVCEYPEILETQPIVDVSSIATDLNREDVPATIPQDLSLWYDGVFLNVVDWNIQRIIRSWPAFSGKPGLTAAIENQRKEDVGTIPNSLYEVDPKKTLSQDKNATGPWDWVKWTLRSSSWGLNMTPIVPLKPQEVYPRKNFWIHGGKIPGSAGCIDLVEYNKNFHSWFSKVDHPIKLYVYYLIITQEIPRTHSIPNNCPNNPGLFCTQNTNCEFNKHYSGDGFFRYRKERDSELKQLILNRSVF